MPSTLYELLGLSKGASPEEVRSAYHQAARRLHPDVNSEPDATELFLHIQEAYEILVNPATRSAYDESLPAQSASPSPISISTLYSITTLPCIPEPQLVYMLLDLTVPQRSSRPRSNPPLNVCLVLDRSTSMQGERMDTVKEAAIELVRQLRADDILSIVVFGDRAEILLPASSRRPERNEIETRIRMIKAGGGTEMQRGLEAGFFEIRRCANKAHVNHLILITDGRTYGDEEACLQIARQASAQGVGITALGIGHEWNDAFLDSLATRTGGSSMFVSKVEDIRRFLQDKFRQLGQVYAKQTTLRMDARPEAELRYAFRLEPEPTPLPVASPMRLGDIPEDCGLSLLLEWAVSPLRSSAAEICLASGSLSMEISGLPDPALCLPFKWTRPFGAATNADRTPQEVLRAVSQVTYYRMQERARQEVAEGKITQATQRLQRLAAHLLSQGKGDLAQQVLLEADHILHTRAFSQEGEKHLKYATRALVLRPERSG